MKLNVLVFSFFIFAFAFSSCQQTKKEDSYDKAIKSEDELINSKEFDNYFNLFFKLSNQNTKTELPFINKFMQENKLWKFRNVCELLDNDIVKSNQKVFDYWKIRCDFQNARSTLMTKYGLDGDSLKIVMEHAISEKQIPFQNNSNQH